MSVYTWTIWDDQPPYTDEEYQQCTHCDAPAQEGSDYCYQCGNSCDTCGRTDCTRHDTTDT